MAEIVWLLEEAAQARLHTHNALDAVEQGALFCNMRAENLGNIPA